MGLISAADRTKIEEEFEKLKHDIKLINFTQRLECQYCKDTEDLLKEVAALSDKISVEINNKLEEKEKADEFNIDKVPATVITSDKDTGIRFFGIPSGYEFSSLLETIIQVSQRKTDLSEETKNKLANIDKPIHIQVFVTPTCPYCHNAVVLAHKLAVENEYIRSDMVEVTEFPQLGQKYEVRVVPKVVVNDQTSFEGALPEDQFVDQVLKTLD